MKTLILLLLTVSISIRAANVNRLNGSVNFLSIDFSIPGPVLPVELARSYNSITAVNETTGWNGAFGWGWSSLAESVLTLTGDRKVLLRDGLSATTITFASVKESPEIKTQFNSDLKRAYFKERYGRKVNDSELAGLTLPPQMEARMANEPKYRAELAAKFHITSPLPRGEVLVASEGQTLAFRNNQWIRQHDGGSQAYDKEGRLVRQTDKNGFALFFTYSQQDKGQFATIRSEDKSVFMKFTWRKNKIIEVVDNRNMRTTYHYDAQGNLTKVTDSANQTYGYRFENPRFPHLITGIDYISDSTDGKPVTRELRYDDNGLVTFIRDKDGAETLYSYGKSTSDPRDHFWTKYTTKRPDGTTDEQLDDYTIKTEPNGARYLARLEVKKNGKTTATSYLPASGQPSQVVEDGVATNYKYYPNGLLMEKTGPSESLKIEYDPRFNKVSQISKNSFVSTFKYDDKGNIIQASNSKSELVTLGYDRFGRITEMRSPSGPKLTFRYGNQGKPTVIDDKANGTIRITYDPTGRIVRTETLPHSGRTPSGKKP